MGLKLPKSRAWREAKGLTRQELAEAAGLSSQTLAGYESGREARPNNARKLAAALDVEVAELMEESQLPKALAQPEQERGRAALADERSRRYRGTAEMGKVACSYWEERLEDEEGLSNDEVYALASVLKPYANALEVATNAELRDLREQYLREDDLRRHSMIEPVRFRWVGILITVSRRRVFDFPNDPDARHRFKDLVDSLDALAREHV